MREFPISSYFDPWLLFQISIPSLSTLARKTSLSPSPYDQVIPVTAYPPSAVCITDQPSSLLCPPMFMLHSIAGGGDAVMGVELGMKRSMMVRGIR